MSRYLVFILISLVLASCSRGLIGFKKNLEIDDFDFQYLTAKARIRFDDGKKDLAGNANIRVQKDSAIWVSISPGLGVEVARILISQDTVYFMDRINRSYLNLAFDQLSSEYAFEIDYHLVESIIMGNLIFPYRREQVQEADGGISYEQEFDNYTFNNLIGADSRKLERLDVIDLATNSTISVNYGEFKEVGEEIFPFEIKASIESPDGDRLPTKITIGFNRAQIGDKPLKFPFDVPSRYKAL